MRFNEQFLRAVFQKTRHFVYTPFWIHTIAGQSANAEIRYLLNILQTTQRGESLNPSHRTALRRRGIDPHNFSLEDIANHMSLPSKRVLQIARIEVDNHQHKGGEWHDEPKLKKDSGIRSGRVPRAILHAIVLKKR